MNRDNYELLSAALLKDMAKKRGIRGLSGMRKSQVVDALVDYDRQKEASREQQGGTGTAFAPASPAPSADRTAAEAVIRSAGAENEDAGGAEKVPHGRAAEGIESGAEGNDSRRADAEPAEPGSMAGLSQRAGREEAAVSSPEQRGSRYASGGSAEERRNAGTRRAAENGTRSFRQRPVQSRQEMQRPAQNRQEMQRPVQARQDLQRPVQNRQEMQRPVQSSQDLQRPVQARQDLQRPVQSSQDLQRPVQTRQDMPQEERSLRSQTDEGSAMFLSESDRPPMDLRQLDSGNMAEGVLEVMADGYGFIRSNNYLPGDDDVYVSPSQIRRFNLKTGDLVGGNTRVHTQQEKFSALLFVRTINGMSPSEAAKRYNFEDMTPVFPNERLRMERTGRELAMRIVDLLSPIGKGQRGMIVSPPKAGKTTLLKDIARSILRNNPEMHLIIMLIDERPEEVTDIREAIVGDNVEVLDSTFDETPEHHRRVAEMGIERAKRLVEHCTDVTILLDSITRLARAYNLIVPPSGRTLSGGLDPAALHPPKRFFGAARNMREGGSLTILATALVDTGSKMDDVVYEEFKGTGNMELILDRKLSERRVFPAIDIVKSGTRRDDLLLDPAEAEAALSMRRALNGMKGEEAVERILDLFAHTRNNAELVARVKGSRII